jgi:hypothetical protein
MKRKTALVAICRRCKHRRLLFPRVLAERLGETFSHGPAKTASLRSVPEPRHGQSP